MVLPGSLTQLDVEGDPAWESVQTRYRLTFELMETCKNSHAKLDETSALRPVTALPGGGSTSPAGETRRLSQPELTLSQLFSHSRKDPSDVHPTRGS